MFSLSLSDSPDNNDPDVDNYTDSTVNDTISTVSFFDTPPPLRPEEFSSSSDSEQSL